MESLVFIQLLLILVLDFNIVLIMDHLNLILKQLNYTLINNINFNQIFLILFIPFFHIS